MRRTTALLCTAVLPLAAAVALAAPAVADTAASDSAPAVTSVAPFSVPVGGGSVTVHGTGFTAGSTVAIGSASATGVAVVSATELTATAPAQAAGIVEVTVTTAAGTSASSRGDVLAYRAVPAVTAVDPVAGPVVGGTTVTITGTHLDGARQVLFGSTPATDVHPISPTTVTAVAPAHAAGKVAVHVVTDAGTSPETNIYPPDAGHYTFGGLSLRAAAVRVRAGHTPASIHLARIACPAVGTCFAVGSYLDAGGLNRPLLERIAQGTPSPLSTGERADIESGKLVDITCPSATRCYAIGEVLNHNATRWSTLLLTWGGGTWTSLRGAPGVEWDHLTCASATSCTATGQLTNGRSSAGSGWPVFLRIAGTTTTLERGASLKATPTSNDGITCSSATDCVQWGQSGTSPHGKAYVEIRRGTTWTAFALPTFRDPQGYPVRAVQLSSVFCTSPGKCTARGSYNRYNSEEFIDDWPAIDTTVTTRPGPVNVTPFVFTDSVSGYAHTALAPMFCRSVTECDTVDVDNRGGSGSGYYYLSGNTWKNTDVQFPQLYGELNDLSCTATAQCLLTGSENRNSPPPNVSSPIAFYGRGATFTAYELPRPAASSGTAGAGVVGCVGDGYCAVAVTTGTGADASDYVVTTSTGVLPGSGPTPPAAPTGPAPVISAVTPWQVSAQHGGRVTITGEHLDGATAVQFGDDPFGDTAGTDLTVTSPTSLTVTAPPRFTAGLVDARVTTSNGGTSGFSPGDVVKYRAAPTVDVVSPTAGPLAGGTTVTITGAFLGDVTGVTFGGSPATSVTHVSDTELTMVSPPHAGGVVGVVVSTTWGESAPANYIYSADLSGLTVSYSELALPPGVHSDDQYINGLACAGRGECYSNGVVQPRYSASHNFFDRSVNGKWSAVTADGDAATVPGGGPIACPTSGECHSVSGGVQTDLSGGSWTTHPIPVNLSWAGLQCPVSGECEGYGVADPSATPLAWPTFARLSGGTAVATPGGSIPGGTPDYTRNQLVCPKVDSCVQWGTYKDADGNDLAYAQTAVGSSWVIRTVPIPGGAAATKSEILAVTCAKAGECVGYGDYSTDGTTFHEMKVTLTGGRLSSVDVSTDPTATKALAGAALTAISCSSEGHCDGIATLPAAAGATYGGGLLARLVDGVWTGTVASNPAADVDYDAVACPQDGFCIVSGDTFDKASHNYPDPEAEVTFDVAGRITALPSHRSTTSGLAIACAPGTRTCSISADHTDPTSYSAFHIDITG